MDGYIARLEKFLGKDHPSTQGFIIIRDLLKRGEAPEIGVFYAGKDMVNHDLVLYSIGEDRVEFKPINFKPDKGERRSLINCLEKATEIAGKIENLSKPTDHLVVLPLDEAAVTELHALQERLKKSGCTINGHKIHYVSVPLTEQRTLYDKALSAAADDHLPVSIQAEALRQGMIARYDAEKAIKTKSSTNIKPKYANPSAIHISAP